MLFIRVLFISLFLFAACDDSVKVIDVKVGQKEFVELFHAIEINNIASLDQGNNGDQVAYKDYIIHKYFLWHPEGIDFYKRYKEKLSTHEEKWRQLLLKAQNFKPAADWIDDYQKVYNKSRKAFLKELRGNAPKLFDSLEAIQNGNTDEAKKALSQFKDTNPYATKLYNANLFQRFFEEYSQDLKKLLRDKYPKRDLSTYSSPSWFDRLIPWGSDSWMGDWEKDSRKVFRDRLNLLLRRQFEQAYINQRSDESSKL
ncbi:MAG: hypothetical protein IEMM0008_0593 [bacterium]|nr:MAG: hypothetical protein IEMM0008_0593 [bacterium]